MGDPHADWPDRTSMADPSGEPTLVFSASQSMREGVPWADGVWVPDDVPTERAATLALAAMPGWIFSTSNAALVTALLGAGATERRHARSMTTPLSTPPPDQPPVAGLRVEPLSAAQVDRHALRLGAINLSAYPPGHPDSFEGDEAGAVSQLRAVARGELLGPMVAESRVALVGGEIVGACLVVDRPGAPPHGGPWVIDLFRDPAASVPGVGTALLGASMRAAREARLPGLSLVVSHANSRARRLYDRLGFVDVDESWTLALPKESERPPVVS